MRTTIISVRAALNEFRQIAEQRYVSTDPAHPGSEIDQRFDQVFADFMGAADRVEMLLHRTISTELSQYRKISILLIVMGLLTLITVSYLLFRMERQRHLHLSTIEVATEEIREQHAELEYLAHFDPLTNLPNRALFLDRLEQAVVHTARGKKHIALLFVDLDKFKSVNDRFGHPAGDALLVFAADRLRSCVRADDTVARLGGDEFTVILTDIGTHESALDAAEHVSTKILRELSQPFTFGQQRTRITASVGVAIFPDDGELADELLSNADRAMFEAKNQGKNSFRFHSIELNERAKRRLRIENELTEALESDQLTIHYQPQWRMQDESLVGIEALVRWNHPRDGPLPPGEFIPIAESGSLIEKLDTWVLENACRQYHAWSEEGLKPGKLCVNLSPMTFRRPDLIRIVSSQVLENCIQNGELELELTESALLENTAHTQDLLKQLKTLGVQLAIDDFGTGYSSMAYLRNFPADTLKIDRSFVQVIHEDPSADAIIRSMVDLAQNLGMEVVAEGIESRSQADFIRSLGCQYGQGYLLAKPMTADELRLMMITQSQENISRLVQKDSLDQQ